MRKFSHLFHSEFQVVKYKKRITDLINKKIDICDKLINNYSSLQNFNRDVKILVKVSYNILTLFLSKIFFIFKENRLD